jgi:hypothetical protein
MAHMRSLANGIVDAALCTAWPETTFRFAMRPDGTALTVTAQPGRSTPSDSAMPEAARRSVPRRLAPLIGTATHQSGAETPAHPTVACGEIHALLQELPLLSAPSEVSFFDWLYFFYERGESSAHAPGGRIVRIGNHPRAQHRLVGRLGDHYRSQDGAKNGSVFRRYMRYAGQTPLPSDASACG